jgi:hypothetical protein
MHVMEHEILRLVKMNIEVSLENRKLLQEVLRHLQPSNRVTGGTFAQTGNPMVPIQPGQSPKFQVTPTFSGPPFPLVGANAAVSTSDSVNAPASIDLTDDPTGATFELNLTAGPVIDPAGEALTVTWTYTNTDGVVATVTGTVTENGIVDDVTGGTFTQVA